MRRGSCESGAGPLLLTGVHSQPGWFLAPHLQSRGDSVVCLGRRATDYGLAWQHCDLATADRASSLAAADQVVHLAPIWLLPELLRRLAAPPRCLVAVSSTSARTKRGSRDPAERAQAARIDNAEGAVMAWATRRGCTCYVLRTTLIYGHPAMGMVAALARRARGWRILPVPYNTHGQRQPLHAADLAAVILALLAGAGLPQGVYELGGGERLPFEELVRRVFLAQGLRPRILRVPAWPLRAALSTLNRLSLIGLTPGLVDRLASDQVAEDGEVWAALGIAPRAFAPEHVGRSCNDSPGG